MARAELSIIVWTPASMRIYYKTEDLQQDVANVEDQSVRSKVGSHWKDWVCQSETRLALGRDQAKNCGLTRAEVIFYIE